MAIVDCAGGAPGDPRRVVMRKIGALLQERLPLWRPLTIQYRTERRVHSTALFAQHRLLRSV